MTEPKAHVSEEKKEQIKELVELVEKNNTILLASIKGLPAAQFQKIKKKLKGKAEVRILKKRALKRTIDSSKKHGITKLDAYLKEDIALLVSDMDSFELAEILNNNKSDIKAKSGQEAPDKIEIEAGQTEILAGPAVSELGSLGLQVKVTNGKIEIIKPKVIVEKGRIISPVAAGVMAKLNIFPFSVGFVPLIAFDSATGKIYTTLLMDKKQLLIDLKNMFAKSRAFAVSLGYISKDTIGIIIAKANAQENALSKLLKEETKEKQEDKTEDEKVKEEDKNE